jgi:hypothetical protein
MPGVEIRFIYRPVAMGCSTFRIVGKRTPEIRKVAVDIVDCFSLRGCGSAQKNRQRSRERLNVIVDVSEPLPDVGGHAGLTAEPWKWRLEINGTYHFDSLRLSFNFLAPVGT